MEAVQSASVWPRLRRLAGCSANLRCGLPAAVNPKILIGRAADQAFEGGGVATCDFIDGIGTVDRFGIDDLFADEFKSWPMWTGDVDAAKSVWKTKCSADTDERAVFQSNQRDGLECRGGLSEKIDKQSSRAGVLIAQQCDVATLSQ